MAFDCAHNSDPLKLVREGCSQPQRRAAALDPGFAPVDQRGPAHGMLFARAYAAFLQYYDSDNKAAGDWTPFFAGDVAVQLAVAAVQDVGDYNATIKQYFDFLADRGNAADDAGLKDRLGYLFSSAATLAAQLDRLQNGLAPDMPLKGMLQTLVRSQLAPAFRQLLLYYRDGQAAALAPPGPWLHDLAAPFEILGGAARFSDVRAQSLSADWIADAAAPDWPSYLTRLDNPALYPPTGIYGSGATLFERVNHIATHNLFTSVFDRFLKAYARLAGEARAALEAAFTARASHEPHYALFLAFLRLFEEVRAELNTLTARHLDFYYRDILCLQQKPAQPGKVRLLAELARQVALHLVPAGTLFKAGKDRRGIEAIFAASRDVVLNQASVTALKTLYRHDAEPVGADATLHRGRLFASPVANSGDGMGAALASSDGAWHPFHNKQYRDGVLAAVAMPQAEIGFAIASHYLLLAEGARTITVEFTLANDFGKSGGDLADGLLCRLTSEEKWLEVRPAECSLAAGRLRLVLELGGAEPALTPYRAKVHGYAFATGLPVLLVSLRHRDDGVYLYGRLQDAVLCSCDLTVVVTGLRALSISNDFGPVDPSKPFQPFGPMPAENNALVVGSREAFQKTLSAARLDIEWLTAPVAYKALPGARIEMLGAGAWTASGIPAQPLDKLAWPLSAGLELPVRDQPDLAAPAPYDLGARHGFLRFRLDAGLGYADYQRDLVAYLREAKPATPKPAPGPVPVAPVMAALSMRYTAHQQIDLKSADPAAFARRAARFFHVAPFGQAEQHPLLSSARKVALLPQFDFDSAGSGTDSGAEFYIGLSGLQPPQNVALLVQVAPGTADPLALKPVPHVTWSYLRDNEWVRLGADEVDDGTAGLLVSGIVTLAVPADASAANTLLPAGMHWIRLAVARKVDAACRLLLVAAQGLEARFADAGNDPAFPAQVLPPGTISRPAEPDAALKQLSQPFASFGGRGAEAADAFHMRISERLRHKDRAIALWDAEHLVLEAFPTVFRARCLNHTQYEPDDKGAGIYRELAPGHVTVVTIPNLEGQVLRDPLRPYTGLDLLQQIGAFLRPRYACFARLHVRNPQFEEVRLAFRLQLRDGYDETFYVNRLQEELTRFLSPWAFPGGAPPSFGGKVRKSVLIDFVEQRPYVDYVTDFQLFHDVGGVPGTSDMEEVEGSRAVSILVSVAPKRHLIDLIRGAAAGAAAEPCPCEAP